MREPQKPRRGIALCLSGGGYRATLFHLGALRRLHELGVLQSPGFRSISSVSGGSIASAFVARAVAGNNGVWPADFTESVEKPALTLTRRDLRTGIVARKYLLPWHWFKGDYSIKSVVSRLSEHLGSSTLADTPSVPAFIFCATNMATGASWTFERKHSGDYQIGYLKSDRKEFTIAMAAGVSACFPLFDPYPIKAEVGEYSGGALPIDVRKKLVEDVRLTDGGVYDNHGLEPVWKDHEVLLVSDGGASMQHEPDESVWWRIKRYQEVQESQSRGLRRRMLMSGFENGTTRGAYWGIGSSRASYEKGDDSGYSKAFATDVLARIRTDLDAFDEVEAGVLMNHGYLMADRGVASHVGDVAPTAAPLKVPRPDLIPPQVTEDHLRESMKSSSKRRLVGRRK